MKVKLDKDERWPDYYISESYGKTVDIPEELIERLKKVEKEYNEVQSLLEKYYD